MKLGVLVQIERMFKNLKASTDEQLQIFLLIFETVLKT